MSVLPQAGGETRPLQTSAAGACLAPVAERGTSIGTGTRCRDVDRTGSGRRDHQLSGQDEFA